MGGTLFCFCCFYTLIITHSFVYIYTHTHIHTYILNALALDGSQGNVEAGIDGGGLIKEFIDSVVKQAFDGNYGLFCETPDGFSYPNPNSQALVLQKKAVPKNLPAIQGSSSIGGAGSDDRSLLGWGDGLYMNEHDDDDDEEEEVEEEEEDVAMEHGGVMNVGFDMMMNPPPGGGILGNLFAAAGFFGGFGGPGGAPPPPPPPPNRSFTQAIPDRSGDHLAQFSFLGRILGKALYEGILVAPRFAYFVLKRMLGRPCTVSDLGSLDPQLARGLRGLLASARKARDEEGTPSGGDSVSSLSLFMAATNGDGSEVPLIPGGEGVPVTSANAHTYVALIAHHRLNTQIAGEVGAFLRGFREVVPLPWMRFFGPSELQLLLSGQEVADVPNLVADLCTHVDLNGFSPGDQYMLLFWRVLSELSPTDFSLFLHFVTSNPRPPLLGFGSLRPRFAITMVPGDGHSRLPTASTCFNLLKLPCYSSETQLKEKLLEAIRECSGFHLT